MKLAFGVFNAQQKLWQGKAKRLKRLQMPKEGKYTCNNMPLMLSGTKSDQCLFFLANFCHWL